ncbi:MAG TPA: DUF4145 domain-containing protein [Stellaceae bacterium]|jgi:hypothetical protein
MTETKIKQLHCNTCGRANNHIILHQESTKWTDYAGLEREEYEISGGCTYKMLKCLGCDDVHFRTLSWFSEDTNAYGAPNIQKNRYPPAISRRRPPWTTGHLQLMLPADIHHFLEEIYISLQDNSLRLTVLGIRALLEQIMVEKVGDHQTLGQNVDAFLQAGYVAPQSHEIFRKSLIEAGNAAMHRGYNPLSDDVDTLLDVTESLVASIYVHPKRAAEVRKKIPQRTP